MKCVSRIRSGRGGVLTFGFTITFTFLSSSFSSIADPLFLENEAEPVLTPHRLTH